MSGAPTTSQISWRELVEALDDKDRHRDSLYPIVYKFSEDVEKRDSGPRKGIYTPP